MKKLFTLLCIAFIAINGSAAALAEGEVSFNIEVTDITATKATVNITPSNNNITYYWELFDKATFDKCVAGGYAGFGINDPLGYMEYIIKNYGCTVDDVSSIGPDSYSFSNLDAGAEWVVFVCVINSDGTCTEPSASKAFSTLAEGSDTGDNDTPVGDFSLTFSISNITTTGATVDVTPSDNTVAYHWDVYSKQEIEEIANSEEMAEMGVYTIEDYMTYLIDFYMTHYDMKLSALTVTGRDRYTYTKLEPGTEYVVVGCAVDSKGVCLLPSSKAEFATIEAVATDNDIAISYSNGIINVTTTNDDTYFMQMETTDDFCQYYPPVNDENVKKELEDWIFTYKFYDSEPLTFKGNMSVNANEFWTTYFAEADLEEDTEYIVMAAPYAGSINGKVAYTVFTNTTGEEAGIKNIPPTNGTSQTVRKMLHDNGKLVIKHGNKKYNAKGQRME